MSRSAPVERLFLNQKFQLQIPPLNLIHQTEINDFIALMKQHQIVVVDARSPGEYFQGHIPGAQNLSLLNNEERHNVGITYKQRGQHEAVKKGLELVGHKFVDYVKQAENLATDRRILVYCWRGGMRSNIMAWLLNLAGFDVYLLIGGYKSYRHLCLEEFSRKREIVILSGKTGTGKTEVLQQLQMAGENILDLEGIAHHKGSAFGALGQLEQPTQEHFENILGWQLHASNDAALWVEDESRFIGRMRIPDLFYDNMHVAPMLGLERSQDERATRILNEYGNFSKEELLEKTLSVRKRMGGENVKQSVDCLMADDLKGWVVPLLDYYDKTYTHSRNQHGSKIQHVIEISGNITSSFIQDLIKAKSELLKS